MASSPRTVLYRKYRPSVFADVRNQEHIVSVLEGAIQKNSIPHAILFSGPRGTGKTSLARIFARAIGTSELDLYEIDAASNRGIDDIRALKEAVFTLPYESARKVYIIDEVHMLTKEAFNALLKTLEEPPEHVVFILATTEEEKLLDTILSRCQVFRLRAPSRTILSETVREVAKKEKFTLSPDAADLIAVAADGSFRDALGTLEKVMLASGDAAGSTDEVADIIGAPRVALTREALEALHVSDVSRGLTAIAEALASNVSMPLFASLILERVRAVMLVRNAPAHAEATLSIFDAETGARIREIAADTTSPINSHMLRMLLTAAEDATHFTLSHIPLETAFIELCQKQK